MCDMCKFEDDNVIDYGEIMKRNNIKVHYYCLLLSTHLLQRGNRGGGILGFLVYDIKKQIKEATKRICCYCDKGSASVKCNKCDDYFHVVCGTKNGCLFEFFDAFVSYCHKHHGILHNSCHEDKSGCYICLKQMGPYNPVASITSKCCNINAWVHRRCIREYALSAGYYLRCLWCKNDAFREDIRRMGIFVPDRDASWEREKGAFSELYKKYNRCDADDCKCPNGREYLKTGRWKILVCITCGAAGSHRECLAQPLEHDGSFQCHHCMDTLNRTVKPQQAQFLKPNSQPPQMQASSSNENICDQTLYLVKSQEPITQTYSLMPIGGTGAKPKTASKSKPKSKPKSSSGQIEPKKIKYEYFIEYLPSDHSKYDFITQDSDGNEISRKTIDNSATKKQEFDEDLIYLLASKYGDEKLLHNYTIEVSDEDDSNMSEKQRLEKFKKKKSVPVPMPQKLPDVDRPMLNFSRSYSPNQSDVLALQGSFKSICFNADVQPAASSKNRGEEKEILVQKMDYFLQSFPEKENEDEDL